MSSLKHHAIPILCSQVNFFDHTKVMVSGLTGLVTFIDDQSVCKTYRITDVARCVLVCVFE